jgi:hypothetical protein
MPIPSFTETLGSALGPGITIIQGGDFFDGSSDDDEAPIDVEQMNREIAFSSADDHMVFMETEAQKEDLPLQAFLDSQQRKK